MRVVAALGGNAISPGSATGTAAEMRARLDATAGLLADLVQHGAALVLTHGNGPQVGRLLLQQEAAAGVVPPMPMDVCGAESQGLIGYLLAQALDSALRGRGLDVTVLCMLTQVVVDPADPAFGRPTKPVGPAGARRVVPSPPPLRFVEEEPLRQVIEAGHVVIAAGGGGIPVVEADDGYAGVEAVVDKDLSAARLAQLARADLLLVLTDVPAVQVGHGTPAARDLQRLTVTEARRLLAAGEFAAGSMGPKVRACCEFVEAGGARAVVAALDDAAAAMLGRAGTEVVAG